jgi:hypothetical protein
LVLSWVLLPDTAIKSGVFAEAEMRIGTVSPLRNAYYVARETLIEADYDELAANLTTTTESISATRAQLEAGLRRMGTERANTVRRAIRLLDQLEGLPRGRPIRPHGRGDPYVPPSGSAVTLNLTTAQVDWLDARGGRGGMVRSLIEHYAKPTPRLPVRVPDPDGHRVHVVVRMTHEAISALDSLVSLAMQRDDRRTSRDIVVRQIIEAERCQG